MSLPDRDTLADVLAAMSSEPDSDVEKEAPLKVESVNDDVLQQRATTPSHGGSPSTSMRGAENAPGVSTDRPARRRAPMTGDAVELKRTLIPILLTCGALLLAGAVLSLAGVVTGWATWVPIVMIAAGLILLGFAALNMLHVRDRLRT
jgi:hypothetical protein